MSQTVEQQDSEYPVNPDFEPLDPDYLADPYPYFARFRSETPVFYTPKIDFWVVSRYEDIQNIKDPETFPNVRVQEPLHPLTPEALEKLKAGVRVTPTTSTADPPPAQAHAQARGKGVLGQACRRARRAHPRDSQRPDRRHDPRRTRRLGGPRFAFPLPASVGALRRYEALRADRTAAIVRRSRRVGTVGQLENPFLCWLRDRAFKMVPAETQIRQIQEIVGYEV